MSNIILNLAKPYEIRTACLNMGESKFLFLIQIYNFMITIGIAGGTGCGKTTVVNQIIEELPFGEVGIISQDSYYKDLSDLNYEARCDVNFDHPSTIDFGLLETHLKTLKSGIPIDQPVYSFAEHNRTGETIRIYPCKVLIVEGILIMTQPEIRDLCDIKIYVHADSDERLIRRLKRDISERNRTLNEVLERYQTTLKPMHQQFIEPTREFADIIIPNNKYNTVAVDIVRTLISEKLAQ
jgi:uridine kinase